MFTYNVKNLIKNLHDFLFPAINRYFGRLDLAIRIFEKSNSAVCLKQIYFFYIQN